MIVGNVGAIVAEAPLYQDRLLGLIQAAAVRIGIETEPTWRTLREQALAQINVQRVFGHDARLGDRHRRHRRRSW